MGLSGKVMKRKKILLLIKTKSNLLISRRIFVVVVVVFLFSKTKYQVDRYLSMSFVGKGEREKKIDRIENRKVLLRLQFSSYMQQLLILIDRKRIKTELSRQTFSYRNDDTKMIIEDLLSISTSFYLLFVYHEYIHTHIINQKKKDTICIFVTTRNRYISIMCEVRTIFITKTKVKYIVYIQKNFLVFCQFFFCFLSVTRHMKYISIHQQKHFDDLYICEYINLFFILTIEYIHWE